MPSHGSRTKKLIVAFHFQQSEQAGWKCDTCRAAGLEIARRCGWLPAAAETPVKIVWARKQVSTERCPKTVVSAQSLDWIERFSIWRKLGAKYPEELGAREIEAFLILEQELLAEGQHG